ncbi:MAG: GGDEF domain-containing protein [Moraxellaceae bacterium]|nr:GGDEF domain-containing protein [Moraxellaceae bacterium]
MKLLYHSALEQLKRSGDWQGELLEHRKSGEAFPQWLHITAVYNNDNQIGPLCWYCIDLTQCKEAEEKLKYLANYDRLTGLANRNCFHDRRIVPAACSRKMHYLAVLYILDRFRPLNDSLGHELGDVLLKKVANVLAKQPVMLTPWLV